MFMYILNSSIEFFIIIILFKLSINDMFISLSIDSECCTCEKGYCMKDNHTFELYKHHFWLTLYQMKNQICACLFHYLLGMLEVLEPKFLKSDRYLS